MMKSYYRYGIILAVIIFALGTLTGCGRESSGKDGKVLTFASADYTSINSILNTHDELPDIIFSGLMKYNSKGEPVPDLTESYDFDQDSLTYTFHLRQGVKWHDGKDFTADDVKFTLDTLTSNKDLEASITDNYKEIASVEVADPLTVKVKLAKPNAAMLNYLTIGILPKHLLEGKDIMTDEFNRHPIGTGRYKFVSWDKGQSIIVAKNDDYYGKKPNIDKIIFKIIPDENMKATQVKSGDIDIAWLNAQNAASFRGNDKFTVYDFKTADYRALAPNFTNAFWIKHKELISVLGYAIDKQAIVESILAGKGEVAYSPLQMNKDYINTDVEKRAFNLQTFLIGDAAPYDPDNGTYDLVVTGASGNYTHYSDQAVDRWLTAARRSYDKAKRQEAYKEFQREWADRPAFIMIAYLDGSYVSSSKVTGLDTSHVLGHHAAGVMWNIEDWDIK